MAQRDRRGVLRSHCEPRDIGTEWHRPVRDRAFGAESASDQAPEQASQGEAEDGEQFALAFFG